jgi:pantetheine-phosphate adenylyltransferase
MTFTYHRAALGGTFDRLHKGHEHLLATALQTASELLIGLTTEPLTISKPLAQLIEPFEVREARLREFLRKSGVQERCSIVPLTDVYGTTLTDPVIDVLVVTEQTLPGAGAINNARQELHLPSLPVVVADLVKDSSGAYLSSTRIRQGVVDRLGQVYLHVFTQDYSISEEQKRRMAEPLGELVPTVADIPPVVLTQAPAVALVGDVVTQAFRDNNMPYTYAVVDGHTRRQPIHHLFGRTALTVANPAGIIRTEAVTAVRHLTTLPKGVLLVDGEEDLIGFPLAFCLPLQSVLVYGQPDKGVVYQVLTEAKKKELLDLF